jgi:3-oxoacyl-[acyl-carrier-protein] synthase-3
MTSQEPVRIAGVATFLPELQVSSREVEERVARESAGFAPRAGIVEAMTGIRSRHIADESVQASDLAVAASVKLLAEVGVSAAELDLVLFASASQDMAEPATAHMLAAKLGASCPVFDVKNACNSLLNGIQVAEALIATGQYERVLVATGETPSRAIRWRVRDFAQFVEAFPGYTLSDAGAAVLLERGGGSGGGIFHRSFVADSTHWDVGTLPGGGSAHPRDPEATYFRMDGPALRRAFQALGRGPLDAALAATGLTWHDFAAICVHQVTLPYLRTFTEGSGVPTDRLVVTLPEHGNLASASLAFGLSTALEQGRAGPGDRVALIGLAGGVSLGVLFAEL